MKACWGWLCVTFVVTFLLVGCGSSNSSNVTIALSPTSATVLLGTSLQFIPNVTGSSNAITWSVNGIANGDATVGTISSGGLYTAPATRPVSASGAAVPIVFAIPNSSIPNSGITGAVIALSGTSNLTNFTSGNTVTISGNSVAGWNGSFIILAAAPLQNGNFGVQIANPAGPPAAGVGGTATATPNITITAQVQDTSAVASAVIALDSGVRVSFGQPCTIGTNEIFDFSTLVSVSGTSNTAVTWSLSGAGTIDPNSGQFTAPATAGPATITATSVADPAESASTTVTIATAADPTIAAVNPPTGALGATFQEIYLSGSNFICTTGVFVNNGVSTVPLPPGSLSALSSGSFLADIPDSILSTIPSSGSTVTLTFTVQRQGGAPQSCSPSPCTLVLSPVRPAVVASSPDSISLPGATSGTFPVTLDGGYFGTSNNFASIIGTAVVQAQFNGNTIAAPTFNADRQIVIPVPNSDVTGSGNGPGLYPITVTNKVSGSTNGSMAAINLAVQPTAAPAPVGSPSVLSVGTRPSSVAIDTARGLAVVANQGSNDITVMSLGSLSSPSLSSPTPSLCTGSALPPGSTCTVASGPTSVSVDNIRKLALVANNASATLAVVDITTPSAPSVTALLTFPSADANGNPFSLAPVAVGINPVSGRALVAFTSGGIGGSNAGAILDLTQSPPKLINVVNLSNGPNPRIAVSPKLNWALATPGGAGSLSIVDLGRQTTNSITSITCSSGVVTVNTTVTVGLQAGQPVLISGASPSSLNGIFPVRSVSNTSFTFAQASCASGSGGTASYALPVATLATPPNVRGVSINDETGKALLADFGGNVPAFVFNILDQTSPAVIGAPPTSNIATAMNPLTNIGVIVNQSSNSGIAVDPTRPTIIGSSFSTGTSPVDVAIDPAANTALVVNQGTNNVSLFSLGTAPQQLRSGAPQIIQSSFAPTGSPSQTSSRVLISSSLTSAGVAQDQTVTLIGTFPSGSVPRLDGDSSAFSGVTILNGGREMTATLSGSFIANNGPRLYALDVQDSSVLSNAAQLQAVQAVNLATGTCSNPAPQGVAIDAAHNVAVVTEPGCNEVSLVSLSNSTTFPVGTGFGSPFELAVGTNPQGVAVYPQAGLAVTANAGSNSASIVDVVNHTVPTAVGTDPIPAGVGVDLGTGKAVVTANGASLLDTFAVSTTAQTPTTIGVQQGPSGIAIDQRNHVAAVANSSSNTASVVKLPSNAATLTSNPISFPQGVAFDPITDTFLITSSATNQVIALNPNTGSASPIRVGIDPSSIAYNFESGTLVTANNLSGTMTIVDFIDRTVRGVFSLKSSTQFAVDIHPQTNLAVVADSVDNQLLLVPLPH
jgi:DNA-binding beta-propeller fold protein YncE